MVRHSRTKRLVMRVGTTVNARKTHWREHDKHNTQYNCANTPQRPSRADHTCILPSLGGPWGNRTPASAMRMRRFTTELKARVDTGYTNARLHASNSSPPAGILFGNPSDDGFLTAGPRGARLFFAKLAHRSGLRFPHAPHAGAALGWPCVASPPGRNRTRVTSSGSSRPIH